MLRTKTVYDMKCQAFKHVTNKIKRSFDSYSNVCLIFLVTCLTGCQGMQTRTDPHAVNAMMQMWGQPTTQPVSQQCEVRPVYVYGRLVRYDMVCR